VNISKPFIIKENAKEYPSYIVLEHKYKKFVLENGVINFLEVKYCCFQYKISIFGFLNKHLLAKSYNKIRREYFFSIPMSSN